MMKKLLASLPLFGLAIATSPAHANNRSACDGAGPILHAAYCGQYSNGGSGPPPTDDRRTCAFYIAASGGSDSNNGNVNNPFATIAHLLSVLNAQTSTSQKVGCFKAGTYSGVSFTLNSSNNNEVLETDTASALGAAILDGTTGSSGTAITIDTATGVDLNGLTIQNAPTNDIGTTGNSSNSITIENNFILNGGGSTTVCSSNNCMGVFMQNGQNWLVEHNVFNGSGALGISLFAYSAGWSVNGSQVASNVFLNNCRVNSDCGVVYTNMIGTQFNGGTVKIINNFIRDYGSSTLTNDVQGVYLDDLSSNVTVTGNVIGPPAAGALNSGNRNNSSSVFDNDDSYNGTSPSASGNNSVTCNILDLGSSSQLITTVEGGSGNTWGHNLILSNFTGALNTSASGRVGFAYYANSANVTVTVEPSDYWNYATGGSIFSNSDGVNGGGNLDPSRLNTNPQVSGYLYTVASGSPFLTTFGCPQIAGGWGPPGYVIPTSTNHSNP